MVFTVAKEVAGSGESSLVDKSQLPIPVRANDGRVKIHQVCVIDTVALCRTDSVGVVANVARRIFSTDVPVVFTETRITQ